MNTCSPVNEVDSCHGEFNPNYGGNFSVINCIASPVPMSTSPRMSEIHRSVLFAKAGTLLICRICLWVFFFLLHSFLFRPFKLRFFQGNEVGGNWDGGSGIPNLGRFSRAYGRTLWKRTSHRMWSCVEYEWWRSCWHSFNVIIGMLILR